MTQAQTQTATITGTITDPTRAAIPEARIILKAVDGRVLQTTADNAGRFLIEAVPGRYFLSVSARAFQVFERTVQVETGAPTIEDFSLTLGRSDCDLCFTPSEQLELLHQPLDMLLPLHTLATYKISARDSKHLHT